MQTKDLIIIGGGPAGMSAAVSAYKEGIKDILIIEREESLGGILKQCIHNGFGLHKFGEQLTGPEYAERYSDEVEKLGIPYITETMVVDVSEDRVVTAVNKKDGYFQIKAGAIVLAMGCRERSRGALNIPGHRPAGIYTAGTAQKFVNIMGYMPGKKVVILGSGDIGLIMARRMTLEGAKVKAVCELMPYSGGLTRNIVQCLEDFDIPLMLSHTITEIHGKDRVEGVTICEVDEKRAPKTETAQYIECDTILLSCGLIPENELSKSAGVVLDRVTSGAVVTESRETNIPGIFACGNVLHVHDLVDFVSDEAEIAGKGAADFIKGIKKCGETVEIVPVDGVRYTVPQKVTKGESTSLYFRVADVYKNVTVALYSGETLLAKKKRPKVAPGEMERFEIKPEYLENTDKLTIKLIRN